MTTHCTRRPHSHSRVNTLNNFRKLAWKHFIYLFLQKTEILETYSPIKLQSNLNCSSVPIYKLIYKRQPCSFTVTWRSQVCKVSKNDILCSTFISFFQFFMFVTGIRICYYVIFCQVKIAMICVLPLLSNYYRCLWINSFQWNNQGDYVINSRLNW